MGANANSGLTTSNRPIGLSGHCIVANNNNIPNINNYSNQVQQTLPLKAISWNYSIDVWWDKVMAEASSECDPVWVDAEDPLFILYTR